MTSGITASCRFATIGARLSRLRKQFLVHFLLVPLAIGSICQSCFAQSATQPLHVPQLTGTPAFSEATGNWQFIPVPLPEREVTHILVSRANDRVWLGTSGGVASYDGVRARAPQFERPDAQQPIYVNSLVEADDGVVIIGTINDSLWQWKDEKIVPLHGACPRNSGGCPRAEWALARAAEGSIYVASSSSAVRDSKALAALKAAVTNTVIPVTEIASFLGFAGEELVAVSNGGSISVIDRTSGTRKRGTELGLPSGNFVRNVSFAAGRVLIGTDTNCLIVELAEGFKLTSLAEGNCRFAYVQGDGTAWLSTNSLYRHGHDGWARWSGPNQSINALSIVEDGNSNLWIGTAEGLWRYFDISRGRRLPGEASPISTIAPDEEGGVVVGLNNGEAWRVSRNFDATQINLPMATNRPGSPYYRGALVAKDSNGKHWILSAAGLFKIDGLEAHRIANYPIEQRERSIAPSTLAVSDAGVACAGLAWSTKVVCAIEGGWREAAEVMGEIGGSAVSGVLFDHAAAMLAVGTKSVTVKSVSSTQLGPFDPTPFGKSHLFGAIAAVNVQDADVVASGGWGGTVFLKRVADQFVVSGTGGPDLLEQPYIIRQFASHPQLGLLAASDEGLFRWEGSAAKGEWKSLREIAPELAGPINGVVPSTGRAFWIASGSRATLINLPSAAPSAMIQRSASIDPIDTNSITYQLATPGLVALPSSKTVKIAYDPPIANAERRIVGPSSRLDLSNLADLTTYRLTFTVSDGFLNVGPPVSSTISVKLPFYRNPYKLATAVVAAFGIAGFFLTRRGPTGFILRRIGRLKWSTEKSDPRFALKVSRIGSETVRYELAAPAKQAPIHLELDLPYSQLSEPRDVLPELVRLAARKRRVGQDFDSTFADASKLLGETALPEAVRFATSQADGGAMSIELSKSLLWLPLELAAGDAEEPMMLRYALGRTVIAEKLAETDEQRSSQLKVSVFAPPIDAMVSLLPRVEAEAKAVAAAARSWGAEVTLVSPTATKKEVLEALCNSHIFHYAGHAEFIPDNAGQSYLPIFKDRIYAADVAEALQAKPRRLLLAFINGCGSSREANWDRGAHVFGFSSAFLNHAAYFIGAQWPIHDEFATSFAEHFYLQLFPAGYSLWWRLLRRDVLRGVPFAEALRLAKQHVRQVSPTATQTWSSYVFYGDPTRRLVLH